jgi:hypothetical protein
MIKEKLMKCTHCEDGLIDKGNYYEECEKCNGDGFISIPFPQDGQVFVNVYSITREYGGPEEGSWYYNDYNCIKTVQCLNSESAELRQELEKEYESYKYGNIYSVLGGRDIEVRTEFEEAASETKDRPVYE